MKHTAAALSLVVMLAIVPGCGGGSNEADSSGSNSASSSSGGANANAFAIAKGKAVYAGTCIACHGEGGKGIKDLGKDWTTSKFIAGKTDDELLAFIRTGRPIDDPLSAGKAAMPPSGGNPKLSDTDLKNVIAFMRTINKP